MATVVKEHLHCEYEKKPHDWTREPTRGRKPKFCPKHRPLVESNSAVTLNPNGFVVLHCVNGKHDWERKPTRGRVPKSCPEHTITPVIVASPRNENGMVTLHCEAGNHDWERAPQRGKRPTNCPEHSVNNLPKSLSEMTEWATERKPGRPKQYENKEEQEAAQLKRSQERAANLDSMLKEKGTHVSQWAEPYILYKKVGEKPSHRKGVPPTITWEKAGEFSPLTSAQWVNAHEKELEDGLFRFEHNGKVVNLL